MKALNDDAPQGISYKIIFAGRHGEGFRMFTHISIFTSSLDLTNLTDNVAEAKYGAKVISVTLDPAAHIP